MFVTHSFVLYCSILILTLYIYRLSLGIVCLLRQFRGHRHRYGFNVTFNNIPVISWRSVLLVEETWVPWENHRPVASHWQYLSYYMVYRVHLATISSFHHFMCIRQVPLIEEEKLDLFGGLVLFDFICYWCITSGSLFY